MSEKRSDGVMGGWSDGWMEYWSDAVQGVQRADVLILLKSITSSLQPSTIAPVLPSLHHSITPTPHPPHPPYAQV
jgi:hypothetical protein